MKDKEKDQKRKEKKEGIKYMAQKSSTYRKYLEDPSLVHKLNYMSC